MTNENLQNQAEMVNQLASTIHKKIVAPAADKMELINQQISHTYKLIEGLEKETSALRAAHSRTTLLAVITALGLAVLIIVITFSK